MKKRRLLPLLTVVGALSLSGCSFFDYLRPTSVIPWEGSKQKLTYTQKDLTPVYYRNFDSMPASGTPKLLVLPIAFTNSSDFISETDKEVIKSRLDKVCFGTTEDTGWHSIKSYYAAESFDTCNIEGEVADWYQSGYSYDQMTDENVPTLVSAAINNWKINNPTKVKDFDSDNNGYIDGVIAIYGGPNYSNEASLHGHKKNRTMWAFTSWSESSANIENPNEKAYIWASYDFMDTDTTHGVSVDGHTYIHEMGHVLGLDDYYDYADKGYWAGGFSMQDCNVGGHDPFSLLSLGWIDPYVPTESATITISPFTTSGDVILLSPDFSSNSAFDEYILIELYSPTGTNQHDSEFQYVNRYPMGPSKAGIRIWHVDARLLQITKSKDKAGREKEYYSIVNTIDPTNGSYIVGCTNTTKTGDPETDKYISLVDELTDFKLLELIRRGDYKAVKTSEYLVQEHLFRSGDTFRLSTYAGYFAKTNRFNNGSKFSWEVTIDSVSSDSATITVKI